MYKQLKTEIKEIIEIVEQCPESLKEKCFVLLLENYLAGINAEEKPLKNPMVRENSSRETSSEAGEGGADIQDSPLNDDISEKDFHVKTLKFLKDNGISMQAINSLYYKENGMLMPFYETLKSTSMQECQMRLAVLTAFENAFASCSGDMTFDCEAVRSRCQVMKCYNNANFTGYFKANKDLWEAWPEKYDKEFVVALSIEGKKKLAEVIIDLAEGV